MPDGQSRLDSPAVPRDREPIPADLERALFIEAGYRCAIPTCRVVAPLLIEHIEDYARVKEHKFENMIVLCANCHGLKGSGPRRLDRKALRQFKANLSLLNHRYGEVERRILDDFAQNPTPNMRFLHGAMQILVRNLVADGYLKVHEEAAGMISSLTYTDGTGTEVNISVPDLVGLSLTPTGKEFLKNWLEARPLPM